MLFSIVILNRRFKKTLGSLAFQWKCKEDLPNTAAFSVYSSGFQIFRACSTLCDLFKIRGIVGSECRTTDRDFCV